MKASDFATSATERDSAAQNLIQTELTDAVNTGLVEKADKSEKSLKGELYSIGKKATTGGTASAALSAVTKGRKGKPGAISASALASQAARGAVSSTLSDSELEGADSVYCGAKSSYRIGKGIKRHLSGRNALQSDKPLGLLSEKKSTKKSIDTATVKRKAQASSYFKKAVYKTTEKAKATTTAAKSVVSVAGHSGGSGFLATFSPMSTLLPIILILLLFMLILGGMAADEAHRKSVGSLEGVPAEVATILKRYGYTNEGIAAILGNMQQESSMNPGTAGDDGYGTDSIGLIQFSGSNKNNFLRWCANNGKAWHSVSAQVEWSFSGEPGTGTVFNDWSSSLAAEPSYYRLDRGFEERFGRDFYRTGEDFKAAADVDLATYSFMACHERCGSSIGYGDDVSRLNKRLEYARNFLAQMNSGSVGGGQDYASAEQWQKDLADACYRVPWPGANLCATWTSNVYRACGYQVHGNGNSVLGHQGYGANYYPSRATTDLSKIKVGMLISSQYGSNNPAGNAYGHVGIYIGNGNVMDSITSGIRTISLSDWISQNNRGWVVCGYPWDWR